MLVTLKCYKKMHEEMLLSTHRDCFHRKTAIYWHISKILQYCESSWPCLTKFLVCIRKLYSSHCVKNTSLRKYVSTTRHFGLRRIAYYLSHDLSSAIMLNINVFLERLRIPAQTTLTFHGGLGEGRLVMFSRQAFTLFFFFCFITKQTGEILESPNQSKRTAVRTLTCRATFSHVLVLLSPFQMFAMIVVQHL